MNQEQIDTINTLLEVLRPLTLALCATNPPAMGKVAHLLRVAAAADEPAVSPVAAAMLKELALGVEIFCVPVQGH